MNGQSTGSALCGSPIDVPKRLSQTEEQLDNIGKSMSYLKDRMIFLKEKLNGVLRSENPNTCSEAKEAQALTPLANSLKMIADDIKYQAIIIDDLLDRLEL